MSESTESLVLFLQAHHLAQIDLLCSAADALALAPVESDAALYVKIKY